jgi:hypothetical protein
MHPVLRRELSDGLFALEGFQRHLGFELAAKYRFPEKGVHYAAKGSGDDSIFAMTFATDLVVHLKGCAC